jgi:predicted acyltransferase
MINLLLLFILLFGAGWAFGRNLIYIPVLMATFPFIWHINLQLKTFQPSSPAFNQPFDVYLALSLGLGAILTIIGLVWGHIYPLSVFLFPLLFFLVYMGPWQFLVKHSPVQLIPSLDQLIFYSIAACLAILSYLLPMFLKIVPLHTLRPPTLEG